MGEPGSRSETEALIIDAPDAQPRLYRVVWGMVTLGFWAFWIYLWLPLLTLVAWVLGLARFSDVMLDQGGFWSLFQVGLWYVLVVVLTGGALILWAQYNRLRFQGRERRNPPRESTLAETLSSPLGVGPTLVESVRDGRTLYVWFDDTGHVSGMESLTPSDREPRPELMERLTRHGLAWPNPPPAADPGQPGTEGPQ